MNNLICIEGPDCVGKATQAALVAKALGGEVLSFPRYDTPQGRVIKQLLAHTSPTYLSMSHEERSTALQSVMTYDRYAAYEKLLEAASGGTPLILDRYWYSGLVYGQLDGLPRDTLLRLHQELPYPRIAILLTLPVEEQKKRLAARGRPADKYEQEQYLLAISELYKRSWKLLPSLRFFQGAVFTTCSGNRPAAEVTEVLLRIIADSEDYRTVPLY